jgi:hypothetical protein
VRCDHYSQDSWHHENPRIGSTVSVRIRATLVVYPETRDVSILITEFGQEWAVCYLSGSKYRASPTYKTFNLRTSALRTGGRRALTHPDLRTVVHATNMGIATWSLRFRVPNKRLTNGNLERNQFVSWDPPVLARSTVQEIRVSPSSLLLLYFALFIT